jgi:hypothetical protein
VVSPQLHQNSTGLAVARKPGKPIEEQHNIAELGALHVSDCRDFDVLRRNLKLTGYDFIPAKGDAQVKAMVAIGLAKVPGPGPWTAMHKLRHKGPQVTGKIVLWRPVSFDVLPVKLHCGFNVPLEPGLVSYKLLEEHLVFLRQSVQAVLPQ